VAIFLSKINTIPRIIRTVLAIVLLTCVLLGIAYQLFMSKPSLPPASPMTPNPIVYVEIPVTDLERASRFYEEVFQFSLESTMVDEYSMALFPAAPGSSGASGALVKGDVYIPSKSGPIVYFGTENIDRTLERVRKAGGKILYPEKRLDGIGSVAEFEDSEGNRIALFAAKP
jgi:predicted enzyme related to lactoylglutathione lyase